MKFTILMATFVASTILCAVGQCMSYNGTCVTSDINVLCAECDWIGYLDGSNVCQPSIITESCPTLPLQCFEYDNCAPSLFGVRCRDCSYRGFLVLDDITGEIKCSCYDTLWDPLNKCSSPFSKRGVVTNITIQRDSAYCNPFQDHVRGCFKNTTDVNVVYGSPNPYTPTECCSEIYGPPPGQLVEVKGGRWQECATYGSWDPDEPLLVSYWRTCSGHGLWNFDQYNCECDNHWNAVQISSDPFAFSCRTCFGFWGPLPPLDSPLDEVVVQHCSVIYAPDEFGDLNECSGHGVYRNGGCDCYYDADNGFWGLDTVSLDYYRILGNGTNFTETHTVQTCAIQLPNPNTLVLTTIPTLAPTLGDCVGCNYFGAVAITSSSPFMTLMDDYNVSIFTNVTHGCCTMGTIAFGSTDALVMYNGSCSQSVKSRAYIGSQWCSLITGCAAYTWRREYDGSFVYYFMDAVYSLVLSVNSGSGTFCPPTQSPIPSPTQFPTAYPTAA